MIDAASCSFIALQTRMIKKDEPNYPKNTGGKKEVSREAAVRETDVTVTGTHNYSRNV